MLLKTYWNDPKVLREKHEEFMRGDFVSQYVMLGWDKLLKGIFCAALLIFAVAGGKKTLSYKLVQEIVSDDMGFNEMWQKYKGYLDYPILKEGLLSKQFLKERFEMDKNLPGAVVSRIGYPL